MYRFFVKKEQIEKGFVSITGADVNHIGNVLRMKAGEEVRISDGESDYYCIIREIGPEQVKAEICYEEKEKTELPSRIYLFQGLPKKDKMELIVQKAVELGAFQIVPVAMSRCVVKLDKKKAETKRQRWQAISESAAKQSKRIVIPEISNVMSYKEAVKLGKSMDVKLLPYENEEGMEASRNLIKSIKPGQTVGIFIGPEGGFSEQEVEQAREAGFCTMSLGRRILRTETAGLAILSVLMYHLEP